MTDDLDRLKAALDAATPQHDPKRKAENLALARKNFAERQGSEDSVRQSSDRPVTGLFRGLKNMISQMNPRGALVATTALVAVGLVITLPEREMRVPVVPVDFSQQERTQTTTRNEEQPARVEPAQAQQAQTEEDTSLGSSLSSSVLDNSFAPLSRQATGLRTLNEYAPAMLPAPMPEPGWAREADSEAFANAPQNTLRITSEDPVSTFSVDVDTASYAIVRSFLRRGQLPSPDAVRIEEMVNYFTYNYEAPGVGDAPFRPSVSVMPTPWNADTKLVRIALQGERPAIASRPPLNLVFLIDTSGSMQAPDKLPLLKQALGLILPQLTEADEVAIVAYAGTAGEVLAPTSADEVATIRTALSRLEAGGGTAGEAGLREAYALAEAMTEEGEVSRVLLATDGDFNVGLSDPKELKTYIADRRDNGIYLSVLGFGRGNLDDATMQALAQNGNGVAGYIDTLAEAQKVLVDQFSGALYPIANDVKVQVEFNPAQIAEYRLIGYETRSLLREDFNNDRVDAGDIGAGHQVTALYEVTPVGSPARLTDELRYGDQSVSSTSEELGYVSLRYKQPGEPESALIEQPIDPSVPGDDEARFAAAIAGFGQLLTGGLYLSDWGYSEVIALANETRGDDPYGYRAEAVQLMRLAQSLAEQP
ncbi:MAG: von Willebrand factor type A domain-containing protein [Pseudomonadota bacterium]